MFSYSRLDKAQQGQESSAVKSPLQGSYNRISYKWWNETRRHPSLCHRKQSI